MTPSVVLTLSRGTVHARVVRRGKTLWAAESSYEGTEDLRDIIASLASEWKPEKRRSFARVELDSSVVQRRSLRDLPPVKSRALRELVANQASRFFRRRGEPIAVDAAWATRDRTEARAVAVSAPLIAAIVDGARAAQLTVVEIVPADVDVRLSLLPPTARAARRRAVVGELSKLAIVAVALWTLGGILYAVDLGRDRRAIEAELELSRGPLDELSQAREHLASAAGMVRQLAAVESDLGWATELLATITEALPDSAHLLSLSMDRQSLGHLVVGGVDAAEVIRHLERHRLAASPLDDDGTPSGYVAVRFAATPVRPNDTDAVVTNGGKVP